MELLYILYKSAGKPATYRLVLPLGHRNGKLCAIETTKVAAGEISRINANKTRLSALSLERKIEWIRNHCPHAYRNGFREIWDKNYTVISRHDIT